MKESVNPYLAISDVPLDWDAIKRSITARDRGERFCTEEEIFAGLHAIVAEEEKRHA